MPTRRASSEALARGSALSSASSRTLVSSRSDLPSGSPCGVLGAREETIPSSCLRSHLALAPCAFDNSVCDDNRHNPDENPGNESGDPIEPGATARLLRRQRG